MDMNNKLNDNNNACVILVSKAFLYMCAVTSTLQLISSSIINNTIAAADCRVFSAGNCINSGQESRLNKIPVPTIAVTVCTNLGFSLNNNSTIYVNISIIAILSNTIANARSSSTEVPATTISLSKYKKSSRTIKCCEYGKSCGAALSSMI